MLIVTSRRRLMPRLAALAGTIGPVLFLAVLLVDDEPAVLRVFSRQLQRHDITTASGAAEALALLGDSYSAYVYACDRDQDPELAESYYRQAMELQPNLVTAASNRAHNLRRLERYAECIALMNRSIRAFPDETPLLAERGACRLLAGDIAGATVDISSLRGNPKIAPAGALVYLGLLELKTARSEEGIRDLEAVISLDASARAELIVAEAYGMAGDAPRARTHLKRAFDLDRSCVATVATSVSFELVRQTDEVRSLLARYGIH